jgi:dTDP-4-dehydrorhamnose 3,5-epimerase
VIDLQYKFTGVNIMAQPVRDKKSIKSDGTEIVTLPDGVSLHDCKVHVDDRGSLCEMFNPEWGWNTKPMTYSYYFTVRPGKVKGWGVHRKHEDRYFIIVGEVELVLYDDRKESPTYKSVFKVLLSDQDRKAINIPSGVYHATHNISDKEAILANFPTELYDRNNPEKYRLPYDTDKIPYSFDAPKGW